MKHFLILLLATLFSCSIGGVIKDVFYQRENYESKLLNEYLAEFLVQTEPYHSGKSIYLCEELEPVTKNFSKNLREYANEVSDANLKEAILDLSNSNKKIVKINFNQLKDLKDVKLVAGSIYNQKKINYKLYGQWEYSLSLPGYSKDSTNLCFTSSYYCGPLCACFSLIYMIKINGKWQFYKEDILLIS